MASAARCVWVVRLPATPVAPVPPGRHGRSRGLTQFGRALADQNIDIICANTPQTKGRVERMKKTLQDRPAKELRLRGISNMDDGNAFLREFMADYNRRFARAPQSAHNAHRLLQAGENLAQTFTCQEELTISRNLTVYFKRVTYLIEPGPETLPLGGKRVQVRERDDGRVETQCAGRTLPYSIFDKNPHVAAGAIVENKRLGAVLAVIKAAQEERDHTRLASKSSRSGRRTGSEPLVRLSRPPALSMSGGGTGAVAAFLHWFEKDQKERTKTQNLRAAKRREERSQALSNRTTERERLG